MPDIQLMSALGRSRPFSFILNERQEGHVSYPKKDGPLTASLGRYWVGTAIEHCEIFCIGINPSALPTGGLTH